MNPIVSLCIVILGIILLIRFIHWLNKSVGNGHILSSYKNSNQKKIKVISVLPIDEKYKIAVISLYEKERFLLLGPTSALVIDHENEKQNDLKYNFKIEEQAT
ncbi:MAG: hypothetical protein HEEMFOPI_00596 [Holosporales bacterium]